MKRGSVKVSDADFVEQWDYQKNDVLPQLVAISSNQKRWWKDQCGHSWQSSPNNRCKGKGCPYCSGRFTAIEHSLATVCPELAKEWNPKNELRPQEVRPKSNKDVWWKCCECEHEWKTSVANRFQNKSGCPVCRFMHGSSSVEVRVYSEIKSVWSDAEIRKKIDGVECDIFIPSLNVAIEVDGKKWHTDSKKDIRKNDTLSKAGVLLIRFREIGLPSLGQEEVFYKNRLSFDDVSRLIEVIGERCGVDAKGYTQKGQFTGDKHYKELMERKAVPRGKLLFEHSPHLKEQWDCTKNADDPLKLTFGSSKKVWWKCSRGHSWEQVVCVRTRDDLGCPFCANKKVCLDNCLAKVNPTLAVQLDTDRNVLTAYDVTSGSGKRMWWKCDQGHSWEENVNNRNHGYGCPYCSGHRKWA